MGGKSGSSTTGLYAGSGVPLEKSVPYDLDAEEAVLGSLLLDRDGIITIDPWLEPRDFYREANGWVYEAIQDLYHRRVPPDLVTLSDTLHRRGILEQIGGLEYLAGLMHKVPTAVHIQYYGTIVWEMSRRRAMITIGGKIAGLGYEIGGEWEYLMSRAHQLMAELERGPKTAWESLNDSWKTNTQEMGDLQSGAAPRGVPSGIPELDDMTGRWQKSDQIIIAALTSRGKSALMLNFTLGAALAGFRVGVFSFEARASSMSRRLLANLSSIPLQDLREANLTPTMWNTVSDTIGTHSEVAERIFFCDHGVSNVDQIPGRVDQLKAARGCDLVCIDYLQLINGMIKGGREQEVAGVSRKLKLMANDLDVPVISLSQLNRAAVGADMPGLHHLRESGSLEQDASLVGFLHRPDSTDPTHVNFLLAKHREGEAEKSLPLLWNGALQRFQYDPAGSGVMTMRR